MTVHWLLSPQRAAGPELAASGRLMTLVKQAVSYQIESSRYRPRNTPKITTYEHGSTARRIHWR